MALLYTTCLPEIQRQLVQKSTYPVPPPIPEPIVKLSRDKFNSLVGSDSKLRSFIQNNQSKPNPLQPLTEILAQILMPLGQYRNLNEAVVRGIEKIEHLLNHTQDNQQEIKTSKKREKSYSADD
jgi:hypothetical protein